MAFAGFGAVGTVRWRYFNLKVAVARACERPPSAAARSTREGVGRPERSGGRPTRLGRREVLCGRGGVGLKGAVARAAQAT